MLDRISALAPLFIYSVVSHILYSLPAHGDLILWDFLHHSNTANYIAIVIAARVTHQLIVHEHKIAFS